MLRLQLFACLAALHTLLPNVRVASDSPAPTDPPDITQPSPSTTAPVPAPSSLDVYITADPPQCASDTDDYIYQNCGFDIRIPGGAAAACLCDADCYGTECCDDYGKRFVDLVPKSVRFSSLDYLVRLFCSGHLCLFLQSWDAERCLLDGECLRLLL